MSQAFAAPSGPPPRTTPQHQDSLDAAIPDEPPPAYSTVANGSETTVEAGPSRMDFSGPPPLPERITNPQPPPQVASPGRMENQITGVGVGYGPRPQHTGNSFSLSGQHPPPPTRVDSGYNHHHNNTHASPAPSPMGNHGNPFNDGAAGSGGPGPSRPNGAAQSQDVSPTNVPTPGRPLLRNGMLLVYPKNHFCPKCQNTGYKNNDPSHPCKNDWSKYGKPYNSALQHSYATSNTQGANPSTTASSNFQRPLPSFHAPQSSYAQQNPYGHLPPPPGQGGLDNKQSWNQYPGQQHHMRPPPPPPAQGNGQVFVQNTPGFAPPGALVVGPGDPRIGGRLCFRCGGDGREFDFFGFSDGRCYQCRGLGRIF